jgi:hypothetical protein
MSDDKKKYTFKVASLMMKAFYGWSPPRGSKFSINHKNCIKSDNRLENLEIITHSANMLHAFENGLISRLENHPTATKKDETVVEALLAHLRDGMKKSQVERKYGLSMQYLNRRLCKKLRNTIWDTNEELKQYEPKL